MSARHFAAVCFTNLSRDHLDYHRSLDDYFETKAPLQFKAGDVLHVEPTAGSRIRRAVGDLWNKP